MVLNNLFAYYHLTCISYFGDIMVVSITDGVLRNAHNVFLLWTLFWIFLWGMVKEVPLQCLGIWVLLAVIVGPVLLFRYCLGCLSSAAWPKSVMGLPALVKASIWYQWIYLGATNIQGTCFYPLSCLPCSCSSIFFNRINWW